VALLAPTEILAQQHYFSARRILEPSGYRIVLLTGSLEDDRKREVRRHIAQGNAQLVIGTHALIEEKVEFAKLGLVIVDEQHRFGVMQRFRLMKKAPAGQPGETVASVRKQQERALLTEAEEPDVLVMTATPIPRTLALTIYGDLDVSVLDELPPGRTPIVTVARPEGKRRAIYKFLREQVAGGRQIYVVYPLVEESEAIDLKAATDMARHLADEIFPDLVVGLLHGRLGFDEKDAIMQRFKAGEIHEIGRAHV